MARTVILGLLVTGMMIGVPGVVAEDPPIDAVEILSLACKDLQEITRDDVCRKVIDEIQNTAGTCIKVDTSKKPLDPTDVKSILYTNSQGQLVLEIPVTGRFLLPLVDDSTTGTLLDRLEDEVNHAVGSGDKSGSLNFGWKLVSISGEGVPIGLGCSGGLL